LTVSLKVPGRELEAIIGAYLSPEHLRNPQTWCVLATLAPELARQSVAVRKRLDGAMLAYIRSDIRHLQRSRLGTAQALTFCAQPSAERFPWSMDRSPRC
jgi:hypothetical protein